MRSLACVACVSVSVVAVVVSAAGCAQPHYDAVLGVAGVAVPDGALAGAFARVTQAADLAHVPALGDKEGGGQTFSLVVRTWDGAAYRETDQVCSVVNFDVAGLHTEISLATARSVPAFSAPVDVVHETGEVSARLQEVWALPGIGDDPLPTDAGDPRVVDMDSDGHPGATVVASGLASGEVYIAQRKTLTLTGVTRSADESFGLVVHKKEAVILDATSPLLKTSAAREQHPDPKESWWHEIRVGTSDGSAADSSTCDDVDSALHNGSLTDLRPFS